MPAFVGPFEIESVQSGAVNFGDCFSIAPKATLKSAYGSGAFNLGNFVNLYNGQSKTNEQSANWSDQQIFNNN